MSRPERGPLSGSSLKKPVLQPFGAHLAPSFIRACALAPVEQSTKFCGSRWSLLVVVTVGRRFESWWLTPKWLVMI